MKHKRQNTGHERRIRTDDTINAASKVSIEYRNIQYKLPKDTAGIIKKPLDIDNFALRLNKAPIFNADNKLDKLNKNIMINIKPDSSIIKAIAERHKISITKQNLITESGRFRPTWRMIVGLGNESIYETSMTLHHVYGIPYIPGSATKGVVRNYIITEFFGKNDTGELDLQKAETRALETEWFCDIFGCPENSIYKKSMQGRIIFFDSIPSSQPKIKIDIMNPHYAPYYSDSSGETPPADYHNPNPIPFLIVEDTEFEFMIGVKENDNIPILEGKFPGRTLIYTAFEWMKKALNEHGIGAKTSVGYGYLMNMDKNK